MVSTRNQALLPSPPPLPPPAQITSDVTSHNTMNYISHIHKLPSITLTHITGETFENKNTYLNLPLLFALNPAFAILVCYFNTHI